MSSNPTNMRNPPLPHPTIMRLRSVALNWLGVYPVVTLLFLLFGAELQQWPLALRTLIVSGVVVGFMSFIWLPLIAYVGTAFSKMFSQHNRS